MGYIIHAQPLCPRTNPDWYTRHFREWCCTPDQQEGTALQVAWEVLAREAA